MLEVKVGMSGSTEDKYTSGFFLAGLDWLSVETLSSGKTKLDVLVTRPLLTGLTDFHCGKKPSQQKAG